MLLVGTLSYNGVSFGGSSQVTLQMETVEDDARRTTAYVRHTLTVQCILSDDTDTGVTMATMRQALTVVGQALVFDGQGAGNFQVNNGGSSTDVKWGPHPRILGWAPVGSLRACEVRWTVEFCLPSCVFVVLSAANPLLAYNYGISYTIDFRGSTSRTIRGYLEIPMTRQGRNVPNSADNYRELINPSIPREFQRTTQDFNLSLDKSRLDFTITDTEIPSDNPLPMGVAKIDAKHSVGWQKSSGMMLRLTNRISVSIELEFHYPMQAAYEAFVRIVKDRLDKAKAVSKGVMLMGVTCEEGIFDRTASFTCSYWFLCDVANLALGGFRQMVVDSGLFSPLLSSPTWDNWALSQAAVVGVRGYQGLVQAAGSDTITDVCIERATLAWESPGDVADPAPPLNPELGIINELPTTENSWISYVASPEVIENFPNCRQAILQVPHSSEGDVTIDQAVSPASPSPGAITGAEFPYATGTPDVIQQNGEPRYSAVVTGYAMRAGYHVPRPNYATIGAATTTRKWICFREWTAGNYLGLIVYCASWRILYDLDKSPGKFGVLQNPEQGNPGV